jgi:hypothetical protein
MERIQYKVCVLTDLGLAEFGYGKRVQTVNKDEEFAELYAEQAGIEDVHTQAVRCMGLRRSRYVGEPRIHLQHDALAYYLVLVH